MAEKALYVAPPNGTLGLELYADRAILRSPFGEDLTIPFAEIQSLSYVEPTRVDFVGPTDLWFQQSGVRMAVLFEGEWIHLPAVPYDLAKELVGNWRKAGLRIDDWPWDPSLPPPSSLLGSLVVRDYKDSADFQREAPLLARGGYDVVSTTQQEQKASGAMWFAAGPWAAMAAKPKAHLIVTYQLRQ